MEAWIEFGRGSLFRFGFSLMVLGLARILALSVVRVVEAYRRSADKAIPWTEVSKQTVAWLVPLRHLWRKRPVYSVTSVLFHVGLLLVPLFLSAHILLWRSTTGLAWPALPQIWADWLTLVTIATAVGLFAGRALDRRARALSGFQDYLWPLLIAVPFATGYLCSNASIAPRTYESLMLIHIYSANAIMILIPFSKIAHCVLMPLSQTVTAVAWKFVPGAGDRVIATLGRPDRPIWVDKSRTNLVNKPAVKEEVAVR